MSRKSPQVGIKESISQLIETGKFGQAETLLSEFHALFPEDSEFFSMQACIHMMQARLDLAEKYLLDGLAVAETDGDLLYNLAYLRNLRQETGKAQAAYFKLRLLATGPYDYDSVRPQKPAPDSAGPLRVLQGTMEIANQMHTLTQQLRAQGVEARALNYFSTYLGYDEDYVFDIGRFKDIAQADRAVKQFVADLVPDFDIFHFHFGTSLTLDNADMPVLKEMGKKILMHHWGSEVRRLSAARRNNPYVEVKSKDERAISKALEKLGRHIDHCIVCDQELAGYVKNYYNHVHILPQAINLDNYPPPKTPERANGKFTIVHAPTSPQIKGTAHLIKAIEELSGKYDIDFKLVQGVSHAQAKEIYRGADLVVDQLLIGCYGLVSIECMAMGKPVVCYIMDYMKHKYPRDLPLISANPDNIKTVLRRLLDNRDMLREVGQQGISYVASYHDVRKLCRQLRSIYEQM